ncbi:MAG TPA: energy transducer TonB, partial [Caulobacteraceae bacterium]|nr:energy transducer TonB [Caulobacteraceae bacterium]
MAEEPKRPEHHYYDPLTSDRPPRHKSSLPIAIPIVLVLYGIIVSYLVLSKFEFKLQEYTDQAVKVNILKAPPP